MIRLVLISLLALTETAAAQEPTDAELAGAMAQCWLHPKVSIIREDIPSTHGVGKTYRKEWGWGAGWEHCADIKREQSARAERLPTPEVSKGIAARLGTKPGYTNHESYGAIK